MINHFYDLSSKASSSDIKHLQPANPKSATSQSMKKATNVVVALVARNSAVHRKIVGLLSTSNIQLTCHRSGHSLAKSHQLQRSHCLIIETELDDMLGVALFKQLLSPNNGVPPTIFITVRPGSTAEAVEAMTLGAIDYIEHPFFARQLISSLELALTA